MTWSVFMAAFWLGIMTAISPCPMATNVAAISFIGRKVGSKLYVIGAGLLYSVGRSMAYAVLGVAVASGALGSAEISRFLQKYMNEALGPILIVLGLALLGQIGLGASFNLASERFQAKVKDGGFIWAAPLGFVFAWSFCPVSAGLFFGGLIPLALGAKSAILAPSVYGVGASLPVALFAFIIAFGSSYVGKAFNKLALVEKWIRTFCGYAFIVVGVYYCLTHIYGFNFLA